MDRSEEHVEELVDFLKSNMNDYNQHKTENIDLLYKSMNEVLNLLLIKKEQMEQTGTPEEFAYLNGQIAGYKLVMSVINAFFDH